MAIRSPAVRVSEAPYTDVVPNLGYTRPLFVGAASKGDIYAPILVTSKQDAIRKLGNPLLTDYGIQALLQYLEKGQAAYYQRVLNLTDPTYGGRTADRPIPGSTAGTPAAAATGTIKFLLSAQPADGDTVSIADGQGSVASIGKVTLVANPIDGDMVVICDEDVTSAIGSLNHAVLPTDTDTVTIRDATGASVTFEFEVSGGVTPGNTAVNISATTTNGAEELKTAINASVLLITAVRSSNVVNLTSEIAGEIGNACTLAVTGTTPPTRSGPNLTGGNEHGIAFEFDNNSTVRTGATAVTIGTTVAATLLNLIQKINAEATLHLTASDNTANNGGIPQVKLTNDALGAAGDGSSMTTVGGVGRITLVAFTGGADGPAKTFEFDSNGSWVPGNVPILIGSSSAVTMFNLLTAINANVSINAIDGTVTVPQANLTNRTTGEVGNIAMSSTGTVIEVTGMAGGAQAIPGPIATVLRLDAASPGTWGNSVFAVITPTAVMGAPAGNFDLIIQAPLPESNTLVNAERFTNLSLDPNSDRSVTLILEEGDYVATSPSLYLRATILSSNGTPTTGTYQIGQAPGNSGRDGIVNGSGTRIITASDIIGSVNGQLATGMKACRNRNTVKFNLLAVPGISHTDVYAEMQSLCEYRGDCFALPDVPFGLSRDEALAWMNGTYSGSAPNPPLAAVNSSYLFFAWPWIRVKDDYNKRSVWLPPSGFLAAVCAYTDQVVGPMAAFAGYQRGVVAGDKIEYNADETDRDLMVTGQNRLNPFVNVVGVGIVLMANRTALRTDGDLSYGNARRLVIFAEEAIVESLNYITFEPNDDVTYQRIETQVNSILEAIRAARGLAKYQVECNRDQTSDADRRERRVNARVKLQMISTSEEINVQVAMYAIGAEFTEPTT
jgi:hypothetical protein